MVKIPDFGDPLVALMDRALIASSKDEKERDYIGASSIGDECSRKLWYKYKGHKEEFDADTLRRFSDGHDTEAKIINWLRLCDGIELHTHDENGNQYGFSAFDEKFKGHYDGIIRGIPQSPKTWHIFEVKCVSDKKYNELVKLKALNEKAALQQWDAVYYAQGMVYCKQENLTRHLLLCATAGGRKLISVRTNADNEFAKAMEAKAQRIISAKEPPERIGGPDYYKCKMCGLRDVCH